MTTPAYNITNVSGLLAAGSMVEREPIRNKLLNVRITHSEPTIKWSDIEYNRQLIKYRYLGKKRRALCTVSDSDGFQDGNGMLDAATASWLELRGAGGRQVRPAP